MQLQLNSEYMLWNIERTFSNIFIPFLNSRATADKISEELFRKVKKELLPCLRSFTRSYYQYLSVKQTCRF